MSIAPGQLDRSKRLHSYVLLVLATVVTFFTGCSRHFYRTQADNEVHYLVDRAATDPKSPISDFTIDIDPRSRMFDPFDPDFPPMPPDDPRSHKLMHCVDGKCGYACWHCNGDTKDVQNPAWLDYLPRNDQGSVVVDHRGAMQLALMNSPDYQEELEDLYLSALDVSFEQFRFDTQFFGGHDSFFTADGRDRAVEGGDSSSTLEFGTGYEARKLFATGAELVVGLANRLVWQFSGDNTQSATTLLDFSLVQPLLRAGGRAVVLERLTISERSLLANVRQMERFRRGFYADVVTGRGGVGGPSRLGGVFGGAGLEGFSGVGSGGFGQIGNVVGGGGGGGFGGGGGVTGAGGGFAGGAGAAGAGGFLGLLQDMQSIRNREANVAALRDSLARLQAAGDADRIDRLQIDQARQALFNAQSQLLTAKFGFESSVESYKIELGLPPDLDITIDDPMLDQFDLLDPRLTRVQNEVGRILDTLRDPDQATTDAFIQRVIAQLQSIVQQTQEHLEVVDADLEQLDQNLPARRRALERLASRPELADVQLDRNAFSAAALNRRAARVSDDHAALVAQIKKTWTAIESIDASDTEARRMLIRVATSVSNELVELSLVQARAQLDAVTLVPVHMAPETALEIARCKRRDWKNARAALVNTWRLIEFNANALESDLDLIFEGDISNKGDNPLEIRGTTGRLRVGVEFDAPLTRLSERNNYRQSIIEYQQARRQYYQFEDRVYLGLRDTLRTIDLNQVNFELRRAAVAVAIAQVDLARLRLNEPPRPGADPELGDTTARDLVSALADLLAVQNDFLSVWVNYEVQRLRLDLDLGTMRLNAEGMWVDPGPIDDESYGDDIAELEVEEIPAPPDVLEFESP